MQNDAQTPHLDSSHRASPGRNLQRAQIAAAVLAVVVAVSTVVAGVIFRGSIAPVPDFLTHEWESTRSVD